MPLLHSSPNPLLPSAPEKLLAKVQEGLLAVEEAVDRQNLNPPFQDSFADQEEGAVTQDRPPLASHIATGTYVLLLHFPLSPLAGEQDSFLAQWKQAVAMATSASQLSVCMVQLERSIAWEKSLLKVVSQGESSLVSDGAHDSVISPVCVCVLYVTWSSVCVCVYCT